MNQILNQLYQVLSSRKKELEKRPDDQKLVTTSYVAQLLHQGTDKINRKIIEEAFEVTQAVSEKKQLIHELSDLFFHLLVLMVEKKITLEELTNELERRSGVSGLTEKKNRSRTK